MIESKNEKKTVDFGGLIRNCYTSRDLVHFVKKLKRTKKIPS